jgi:hypothetical protein
MSRLELIENAMKFLVGHLILDGALGSNLQELVSILNDDDLMVK